MVEKIEVALNSNKQAPAYSQLDRRLETLEGLLRQNLEQHSKLISSVDNLRDSLSRNTGGVKLGQEQTEQLAREISSSSSNQITELSTTVTAIRSEMALASSLSLVDNKVDSLNSLLDKVHSTTLKVDYNISDMRKEVSKASEVTNNEITQVRKNSDNSLQMFESMMNSLKNIEMSNNKTSPTQHSVPNPNSESLSHPEIEIPLRKGIMFTSSIGLDTDVKRYKEELKVELKIIPTYYIMENQSAQDPDAYLGSMVNQHLRGKPGYQFVILAVGTNDISDLDCDNSPPTTLFTEVSTQTKTLFDLADSLVKEMNIDVFIVDKPPRYDSTSDPKCMKQKLTKYANGVLASNTGATPRIFLVEQASLARSPGKGRSDIFQQDGLHLTTKGVHFYTTNIISVMKDCYPDTQSLQRHVGGHEPTQAGVGDAYGQGQGGRHGQAGERDQGAGHNRWGQQKTRQREERSGWTTPVQP